MRFAQRLHGRVAGAHCRVEIRDRPPCRRDVAEQLLQCVHCARSRAHSGTRGSFV